MQVYGFLEKAQLENVSADLSNTLLGLFWYNTTDNKMKIYDGAVRAMVTENGSATLTNKIFSGGTITGAAISGGTLAGIDINLGAATDANKLVVSSETTANLEALTREAGSIYWSTDDLAYKGDDGLNLVELGGGGAGGINYTVNPDFETNADDHVAYKDSASEVPDDGIGGAPTLAVTRSTVAPLAGKASGIIAKPASNVQGEGINVHNEDFDEADKGKIQIMSFEYDASDVNYNDGDFRVYFKDETNGNVIRVNGEDVKGGKGTHYARVQIPIDCDNGSLLIHCAATHADAVSFKYDRVSFGPQKIVNGSLMTDWKEFSPVGSWTSNTVYHGSYRRVGDSLEVDVFMEFTGAPNAANLVVDLPNGLRMDTSKLASPDFTHILGNINVSDNSVAGLGMQGYVAYESDTEVYFSIENAGSPNQQTTLSNVNPVPLNSGDHISFKFKVPIQGWSSQTIVSEDFGGRDVIVEAFGNGNTALTSGVTDIDWTTKVRDTTASWDGTTFLVPETGSYIISGFVRLAVNGSFGMRAYIDGVQDSYLVYDIDTNSTIHHFQETFVFEKGQQVTFRSVVSSPALTNSNIHRINIKKLGSSQQVLETEIVAATYSSDSGQVVNSGSNYVYEDLINDSHNAYNTSTGVYTIPVTGSYAIGSSARAGISQAHVTTIRHNGNDVSQAFQGNTDDSSVKDFIIYPCIKGDTIEIKNSTGITKTLTTTSTDNTFSIARVK